MGADVPVTARAAATPVDAPAPPRHSGPPTAATAARAGEPAWPGGATSLGEAQRDAEIVRRHLVRLRGGAPFLSPADGALLVRWLDDGVPVHRILGGLEAAAAARHARRTRAPLALSHARAHLGGPRVAVDVPVAASPSGHPLEPLVADLRASPLAAEHPALVRDAAATLLALPADTPDTLTTAAIDRLGALFDACWCALDDAARAPYVDHAETVLADILPKVDDARADALVEEYARAALRDRAPGCSATDVLRLVCP